MEKVIIRPIEEKDNKEIATLIRKVFEEFDAPKTESVYSDPLTDRLFQSFYQHPRTGYWVVEYNGSIVGGCGFYPTEGLDTDCAEIVKYNPQIEMFAHFKTKSSFHKTKCIN